MDQSLLRQFKTGSWSEHNKAWMSKMSEDAKNRQIGTPSPKIPKFCQKSPDFCQKSPKYYHISNLLILVLLYQQIVDAVLLYQEFADIILLYQEFADTVLVTTVLLCQEFADN